MRRRIFEEMITYFNQTVSGMDIDRKYKMTLLGIVTALLQKHDEELAKNSPKVNSDSDELISRQAAIDRINKQREHLQPDIYPQDKIGDAAYRICAEFIERLPSAQPEIIRCKDCNKASKCYGDVIMRSRGGENIYYPLEFCSEAERRTDEQDSE